MIWPCSSAFICVHLRRVVAVLVEGSREARRKADEAFRSRISKSSRFTPLNAAYAALRSRIQPGQAMSRNAPLGEYFVVAEGMVQTIEYRPQWMDATRKVLRMRWWDNAGHHRALANFPHHEHVGDEDTVQPGKLLSVIDMVGIIETDIS